MATPPPFRQRPSPLANPLKIAASVAQFEYLDTTASHPFPAMVARAFAGNNVETGPSDCTRLNGDFGFGLKYLSMRKFIWSFEVGAGDYT
jgi:hypothetical protein